MEGIELLVSTMSDSDLKAWKDKNKDNKSVQDVIDGILKTREYEATQATMKAEFEAKVSELFTELPHPDGIYNVYAGWKEVEVNVGEPKIVYFTSDGHVPYIPPGNMKPETLQAKISGGEIIPEERYEKSKVWQWVVEVNKAHNIKSGASGKTTTRKNAITVRRLVSDDKPLETVGNYRSASEACKALSIAVGGDSAVRALTREGFLTFPYDGSDFTVTEN